MKKEIVFSVIIPVRTITPYVKETISFLKKLLYKKFEIIVITDKKESYPGVVVIASGEPTPAFKRNLGAKKAKGEFLAFLDDDSYPDKPWLNRALAIFKEGQEVAGVCGPTLTPPSDSVYQKASGWIWASWLGSGAAGVYRNRVKSRREVDDFPSVNLLVRKEDFDKVGGFDINHWPGEDTKLCLDLVNLGKKIIYDPEVLVFHHRRAVFIPHLKQISRYAMRRGYFARVFPETSFRIGYFLPAIGAYGMIFGLIVAFFFSFLRPIYFFLLLLYLFLILLSGLEVYLKERNFKLSTLVMLGIFSTHMVYGLLFPFGFFKKKLKTIPHKVDLKKKSYIGG